MGALSPRLDTVLHAKVAHLRKVSDSGSRSEEVLDARIVLVLTETK